MVVAAEDPNLDTNRLEDRGRYHETTKMRTMTRDAQRQDLRYHHSHHLSNT